MCKPAFRTIRELVLSYLYAINKEKVSFRLVVLFLHTLVFVFYLLPIYTPYSAHDIWCPVQFRIRTTKGQSLFLSLVASMLEGNSRGLLRIGCTCKMNNLKQNGIGSTRIYPSYNCGLLFVCRLPRTNLHFFLQCTLRYL